MAYINVAYPISKSNDNATNDNATNENFESNVLENNMLKEKILKMELENNVQNKKLLELEKIVLQMQNQNGSLNILNTNNHLNNSLNDNKSNIHPYFFNEPEQINKNNCNLPQKLIVGSMRDEGEINNTIQKSLDKNEIIMEDRSTKKNNYVVKCTYRKQVCENNIHSNDTATYTSENFKNYSEDDMLTLMEEFDQHAVEKGILQNSSPAHSVASEYSEILEPPEYLQEEFFAATPLPIFLTPSSENFLQSREYISESYKIFPQLKDNDFPKLDTNIEQPPDQIISSHHLLQSSLKTPVLLTAEALRESNESTSSHAVYSILTQSPLSYKSSSSQQDSDKIISTNPFKNLLAGLKQPVNFPIHFKKVRTGLGKSNSLISCADSVKSLASVSTYASTHARIRKWQNSLQKPWLSPMSESQYSCVIDKGSDEDDMVVDEVVSLAVGDKSSSRRRLRNESICSISGPCVPPDLLHDTSKSGLVHLTCEPGADEIIEVAGDLDLSSDDDEEVVETCEEQILLLKGSLPGEQPLSPFATGGAGNVTGCESSQQRHQKEQNEEDDLPLDAPETPGRGASAAAAAAVSLLQEDVESDVIPETPATPGGGVIKGSAQTLVAQQNNLATKITLSSLKQDSSPVRVPKTPMSGLVPKTPGSRSILGSKDLKLPAGSIILAVVNEAGSLVPLPVTPSQLNNVKMAAAAASKSRSRSIKSAVAVTPVTPVVSTSQEDDVDVETVMEEKTPVLEAGDLDSLLAQFEASEAVNVNGAVSPHHSDIDDIDCPPTPGKSCIKLATPPTPGKDNKKSCGATVVVSPTPGRDLAKANPLPGIVPLINAAQQHQKIMDALPKEIIDKIKASTKRKSTQMLAEPMVVHKGRGVKLQDVSGRNSKSQRNQTKAPATSALTTNTPASAPFRGERIPPPLDHDYCFSPADKKLKSEDLESPTTPGNDIFNKLPDYYTSISSNKKSEEDSGKKDSGVESGDVSDASVDADTHRTVTRQLNSETKQDRPNDNVLSKLPAYVTDISNTKREIEENIQVDDADTKNKPLEVQKVKRKLNLVEYRERVRSAASSRCASPSLTESSVCSPASSGHAAEAEDIKAQAGGSPIAELPTPMSEVVEEETIKQGTSVQERAIDTKEDIGVGDRLSNDCDIFKDTNICDNTLACEVTVNTGGEDDVEEGELKEDCNSELKEDCNSELKGDCNSKLKEDYNIELKEVGNSELKEVDNGELKEVDNSELKEVCNSELKEVGNSELKEVGNSELKEVGNSELKEVGNSELKEVGNSELKEVGNSELKEIGNSELKEDDNSELKEDDNSELKENDNSELKENDNSEFKEDCNNELWHIATGIPMSKAENKPLKSKAGNKYLKSMAKKKPLKLQGLSEAPAFQCVKVSPMNLGASTTVSTANVIPPIPPTVIGENNLIPPIPPTVIGENNLIPPIPSTVIGEKGHSNSIKNNKNVPIVSSQAQTISGSPLKDGRSRKYQRSRNVFRHRSHSSSRSRSPSPKNSYHRSRNRSGNHHRRRNHNSSSSASHPRSRRWSTRSRSRGRSRSSSSSCSSCSCSSSSRSCSRSKSRSRTRSRSRARSHRERSRDYAQRCARSNNSRNWSYKSPSRRYSRQSRSPSFRRSRSPRRRSRSPKRRYEEDERVKQVEERRVIYIGRIAEGTTKAELKHRFSKFGTITDISVHFRDHGDNYGFVTFRNRDEAYKAIEHGNDDASLPPYDLCFGGRRAFCKVQYSDLDAQQEDDSGWGALRGSRSSGGGPSSSAASMDFDALLKAAMKNKR